MGKVIEGRALLENGKIHIRSSRVAGSRLL
jgi:hypothetical protein